MTLLALACNGLLLLDFYLGTAHLAPGTGIRPMGWAAAVVVVGFSFIILGGFCALIGFLLSLVRKRWRMSLLAIFVGILAWMPWEVAFRGSRYIAAVRNLVWAE